jgi:hypothetical protein
MEKPQVATPISNEVRSEEKEGGVGGVEKNVGGVDVNEKKGVKGVGLHEGEHEESVSYGKTPDGTGA